LEKKYLKLGNGILCFFKNDSTTSAPDGELTIENITSLDYSFESYGGQENVIILHNENEKLVLFSCSDGTDMLDWFYIIQLNKEKLKSKRITW